MSKFLDFLSEPQYFSHGCYIVAQEAMTKEDFAKFIAEVKDFGDKDYIPIDEITEDWVHFHFGYTDDCEKKNQWWTGCGHIKNSKPVWSF